MFKVGDRVRCKKEKDFDGIAGAGYDPGREFTVDKISSASGGTILWPKHQYTLKGGAFVGYSGVYTRAVEPLYPKKVIEEFNKLKAKIISEKGIK